MDESKVKKKISLLLFSLHSIAMFWNSVEYFILLNYAIHGKFDMLTPLSSQNITSVDFYMYTNTTLHS